MYILCLVHCVVLAQAAAPRGYVNPDAAAGDTSSLNSTLPSVDSEDEDDSFVAPSMMSPLGGDGHGRRPARMPQDAGARPQHASARPNFRSAGGGSISPTRDLDDSEMLDEDELLSSDDDHVPLGDGAAILSEVARLYAAQQAQARSNEASRRDLRFAGRRPEARRTSSIPSDNDGDDTMSELGEDDEDGCSICRNPGHASAQCPLWEADARRRPPS